MINNPQKGHGDKTPKPRQTQRNWLGKSVFLGPDIVFSLFPSFSLADVLCDPNAFIYR